MKRMAMQEAVRLSFRITSRGINAWAPARRSSRTKEATRRAASASSPIVFGSPQPPVVDLVEGDEQGDDPDRERRDPRVVDPPLVALRLLHVDQQVGDPDREEGDRDVEEEDPAPAQLLGEAHHRSGPDGVAEAGGADDDPARLSADAGGRRACASRSLR
jgi:hypothetical protein